jgi:hypothetical protein
VDDVGTLKLMDLPKCHMVVMNNPQPKFKLQNYLFSIQKLCNLEFICFQVATTHDDEPFAIKFSKKANFNKM